MQAPLAAELLGAWGRWEGLGPIGREDVLLRLALPDEDPAQLPVFERDANLLELRELLFGGTLDGTAECERCGETVEYSIGTETLRPRRPEQGSFELTVA